MKIVRLEEPRVGDKNFCCNVVCCNVIGGGPSKSP